MFTYKTCTKSISTEKEERTSELFGNFARGIHFLHKKFASDVLMVNYDLFMIPKGKLKDEEVKFLQDIGWSNILDGVIFTNTGNHNLDAWKYEYR